MQWGKSLWHVQQSPLLLNFCWNGARQCWIPIHENWKWNAHKGFSFRDGQDELAHKPVSVDLDPRNSVLIWKQTQENLLIQEGTLSVGVAVWKKITEMC